MITLIKQGWSFVDVVIAWLINELEIYATYCCYEYCHYMTCFHDLDQFCYCDSACLSRSDCVTITQIVIAKLFMIIQNQVTILPLKFCNTFKCFIIVVIIHFLSGWHNMLVWMLENILESHPKQSEVFVMYDSDCTLVSHHKVFSASL